MAMLTLGKSIKGEYCKILAHDYLLSTLKSDGWEMYDPEKANGKKVPVTEKEPEPPLLVPDGKTVDGDKGLGRPGSIEWHTNVINGMKSNKEIADHVQKSLGIKINAGGRIDYLRKRAIKTLSDAIRNK